MKSAAILALVCCAGLAACGREQPSEATPAEAPTIAVTQWTEKTELFMEYPPLVAGETARFAVHLTDLRTFKPLTKGRVLVELRPSAGGTGVFQTEGTGAGEDYPSHSAAVRPRRVGACG